MPALLFAPLFALLLALASPATAECQPDADAASEPPYTGYTPTGYKGVMARDAVRHRVVRARETPDGAQVYQLRPKMGSGNTAGFRYDSIEPIDLGGRRHGFVARHAGCAHLLDSAGRQLATPAFSHTEGIYDYKPPGKRLLKLATNGPKGTTYRYALFAGGRLKAVSPHDYLTSYHSPSLPESYLPKNLAAIAVKEQDGHGLIDLDTLDEVVQPVWRGVGGLGLPDEGGPGRYLLTDDGKTRTLFSPDGRRRLLGNIDKIALIPNWFAYQPGLKPADRAIITATEAGEQSCRLFDIHLNLLLPQIIPLDQGQCPSQPAGYPPKYFAASANDGLIHVYSLEKIGRLLSLSIIPGTLVGTAPSGMVITWIETPQGKRYRAFLPDGKRANEDEFDDFRHLGCGFFEVRKGKQWLTLHHDGTVTEKRYFPFSC